CSSDLAVPTTRLRDAFCNVTISIPNANLFANSVSGADAFRYRVTNLTSNEVDEVVREGSGSLRFVLIWASSYSSDDNVYSVEVAARVGGVWGAYGTPCSVTVGMPNPIRVMNNSSDATVIGYPNPFSDGFSLRVNQNQPTDLVVTVYDMTGKVLEVVRWNTQNSNVLIGKNLPSGVYNIFVEGGEI
ncbi:T9SS type A sorting domain-containing protein, partial [Arthrospira platensis SPKY1]|nr:T9SS type A sorting domain-containing protein [Arthrospira platensis SPKY1]